MRGNRAPAPRTFSLHLREATELRAGLTTELPAGLKGKSRVVKLCVMGIPGNTVAGSLRPVIQMEVDAP